MSTNATIHSQQEENNDQRKKRGLINFIGSAEKWMFGVMDEDDRQQINEQLNVISTNNHNAIATLNEQIKLNSHFSDSIESLKTALDNDREMVSKYTKGTKAQLNDIIKHILHSDQLWKLKYLEDKIDSIQDNIASAKYNIIQPSILTAEEIELFQIDYFKLKMMKIDVSFYKENSLIIAIKFPKNFIKTFLKLIVPIPNSNFIEINEPEQYTVTIDSNTFEYKDNTEFKYLKKSKACIFNADCPYRYNNKTEINIYDDETIIIKNARNENIIQNCDDRNITVNGNLLINFYNCSLEIKKEIFSNKITTIKDKFYYPNLHLKSNDDEQIKFTNISIPDFYNLKEIKELKYHKNISYTLSSLTLVLLILSILIILYTLKRQNKKTKINIINKTQECFELRGGGVTSQTPATSAPTQITW